MNEVRQRVLDEIKPYLDFAQHKDLIAFTVGADYFSYDYETDAELEADFNEIIVAVEKDWLFEHMKNSGVENPSDYLKNEYTWDDSHEWLISASLFGKVVVIEFN